MLKRHAEIKLIQSKPKDIQSKPTNNKTTVLDQKESSVSKNLPPNVKSTVSNKDIQSNPISNNFTNSDIMESSISENLPQTVKSTVSNNETNKINQLLQERYDLLEKIHFTKHLKNFTEKQQKMYEKSLNNSNYIEAMDKTHLLCEALTQARKNFLSLDELDFEKAQQTFKSDCLKAVTDVRPVLDKHLEWKGQIKKFLLDILSALSFGLTKQLGLFGKTDSGTKLDSLEQELKNKLF